MSEDTFYRKLARHVGLRFLESPPAVAAGVDAGIAASAGIAPLVPNAAGLSHILAPRGMALQTFVENYRGRRGVRRSAAIVTPRRLALAAQRAASPAIANNASYDLWRHEPAMSAIDPFSYRQIAAISVTVGLVVFGMRTDAALTADIGLFLCSLAFLVATFTRFCAILTSGAEPRPRAGRLPDHQLPIYSLIVPLYREAHVVDRIVLALVAMDYPPAKLDILFVVEAGDVDTIAALEAHDLAYRYTMIVAPDGAPRTKPRALNVALPFAEGAFIVVYDAEDEPEPGQLRAAVARFSETSGQVACLQARLAIDNIGDGWLTRMFAIEYAALFSVANPGYCAMRLPMLLGGSSNHFRAAALNRVHGWDAWNLTEDADLGIRLARFGYGVETLDSTSFEEAPSSFRAWLGQRRRWIHGWIQTWAVHARHPARLARDLGVIDAGVTLVTMGCMVLSLLFAPVFASLAVVSIADGTLFRPADPLQMCASSIALSVIVLGSFNFVAAPWVGLGRRGARRLRAWLPLLPIYHGLLMVAAWCAFLDLCRKPYVWRKTEHGLAKTSWRHDGRQGGGEVGEEWNDPV